MGHCGSNANGITRFQMAPQQQQQHPQPSFLLEYLLQKFERDGRGVGRKKKRPLQYRHINRKNNNYHVRIA